MKPEPVYKYMSVAPQTVTRDRTLGEAKALMIERGFRHLPVVDENAIVGVLSLREVELVMAASGPDGDMLTVESAMTPEPYIVTPDAHLDEVAAEMASRRCGCAIVVDRTSVVGVFTTVDALRALARFAGREDAT
jgi:acetoin utilization protein AcuB